MTLIAINIANVNILDKCAKRPTYVMAEKKRLLSIEKMATITVFCGKGHNCVNSANVYNCGCFVNICATWDT